jgi:hypothetical protein
MENPYTRKLLSPKKMMMKETGLAKEEAKTRRSGNLAD